MTFYICYYKSDKSKVFKYLKKLYPEQENVINVIIASIKETKYDYLFINNDVIEINLKISCFTIPIFDEETFINAVELLFETNEKSRIIKYVELKKIIFDTINVYNKFEHLHLCYINNKYYYISQFEYETFLKILNRLHMIIS